MNTDRQIEQGIRDALERAQAALLRAESDRDAWEARFHATDAELNAARHVAEHNAEECRRMGERFATAAAERDALQALNDRARHQSTADRAALAAAADAVLRYATIVQHAARMDLAPDVLQKRAIRALGVQP